MQLGISLLKIRKFSYATLACLISICGALYADEETDTVTNTSEEQAAQKTPSYSDTITLSDSYLEGYTQSLIDNNYPGYSVKVIVRNRYAYLYKLPKDESVKLGIEALIATVVGIKGVYAKEGMESIKHTHNHDLPRKPRIKGIWFPQNTVLFPPLIADPRAILNSISYRWQWGEASDWLGKNAVAVSFGDIFPLYRFIDVGKLHAKIQFSLEAAAWPLFRIDHQEVNDWSEFVNVDFFIGIPVTMAVQKFSFRFRIFHVSTHIGDELMVNNPNLVRYNPSFEGVDFFTAYQVGDNFKPYVGMGVVYRTDKTYPVKPIYVEYGGEYRFFRRVVHYNRLYGQAFVAAHVKNDETRDYNMDVTVVAGYEWSKLLGAGRRFRLFAEWHNGYAPDGQFYKTRLSYFGLRISYGF